MVHLTTAIILILTGSIIEYTEYANKIVFSINCLVSIIHFIYGLILLDGQNILTQMFEEGAYRFIPIELIFALADSIKYLQLIYISKWINRKYLVVIVGIWFTGLGMNNWVTYIPMKELYDPDDFAEY